ncbi:hypothetical protein [Sorangium sp. So ce1335]|uniref:hypothetical protein n=1 Tax=Sorangium sp. So ce1335 TaxID=3133335 RepID=UPI003F645168
MTEARHTAAQASRAPGPLPHHAALRSNPVEIPGNGRRAHLEERGGLRVRRGRVPCCAAWHAGRMSGARRAFMPVRAVREMLLAVLLGTAVASVHGCQRRKTPEPQARDAAAVTCAEPARADLALDPPRVVNLTLTPRSGFGEGGALVRAQVAEHGHLPPELTLHIEQGLVKLRDDGEGADEQPRDGTYTGLAPLSAEEIAAERDPIEQAGDGSATVFDGRVVVPRPNERWRRDLLQEHLREESTHVVRNEHRATEVDPDRTLLITDLSVIEDKSRTFDICDKANPGTSMGKWTFGHLVAQMANEGETGVRPTDFMERWIKHWSAEQKINGWSVPARAGVQRTFEQWPRRQDGSLDLARAPFRLLAIVNRVDLRDALVFGSGRASELRFVFGVVEPTSCSRLPFTVILEYRVERQGCKELKDWARQWVELTKLGQSAYNAALEAITESVTRAGAAPDRPNGSALGQLRTNQIEPGELWEMREFRIGRSGPSARYLVETPVVQTPDLTLKNEPILADFISKHTDEIGENRHEVPLEFPPGKMFLAGSAIVPQGHFWQTMGDVAYETRRNFSLATCNGCHAEETSTPFLHIGNRDLGKRPALSGFLTGLDVPDPAQTGKSSRFADIERRGQDLATLVNESCLAEVLRAPLRMTH